MVGISERRGSVAEPKRGRFATLLAQKSLRLLTWETAVAASIILSAFLVTFQAAFNASVVWQCVLIYLLDALYITAIVVRCLTGYKKRGVAVTEKRKIVLNYLKTSLLPDLLSVLPLELFAFASSNVTWVAAILRLNRCMRCYRVWTLLSGKEKELGTNTSLLMGLRFAYLAGFSIHVMTCIWFAVSCWNEVEVLARGATCRAGTWALNTNPAMNWTSASDLEKYVVTLYWTVTTITSVGYGDILPATEGEKWVSTAFMLWGIILFGYILGGLASTLTNSDAQRARYIHRLNTIRDHLNEASISSELRKKVIGYYEYLWQRNRGKGVTELFDELPRAFQAELSLETYRSMIERSSLFKDAPEEFMRMLSLVVRHMLYLPSQVIINKGDIGHHMYFISKGEVEILPDEHLPPVEVLSEGNLFGEINLVYSVPCAGTVRARTHCDILLLSRSDTTHILQHFPDISQKMKAEVRQRCDSAFSHVPSSPLDSSVTTMGSSGSHWAQGRRRSPETTLTSWLRMFRTWWSSHPVVPGSKFTIFWDLAVVIVTTIICCVYSYEAGFSHFKPSVSYSHSVTGCAVFVLTYLLDAVLLADIFVCMKKAIPTPTGMITDAKTIAVSYLCSLAFVLDLLSILPLEILSLGWVGRGESWETVPLFKLNRLIKAWKVMAFFNQLEGSLYISVAYVRALKFTLYILTTTHISACIWFPLACFSEGSCHESSWAANHISANTTGLHDYIVSIYWASATLTTVGYGDISAHNTQEMILALIVQLIGVMLYGYCLGAIAATLTNAASPRISFQEKMEVVHQFMYNHNLGKGLLERVDHYFSLLWRQFKGEAVPGGQSIMHDMPRSVREDVSMEECATLLSNVPFFKHADMSFLRRVSLTASTYLFAPGDIVLYSGDMGREMYCVKRGYVEVLSEDSSQVVTVVGPGGYFGELGYLFGSPRLSTMRAATNCELAMLNWTDLDRVLVSYPLIAKEFEDICSDKEHLKVAQEAVLEASCLAMNNPRQFNRPCILTALAVAMATPLSIVVRAPLANSIAACVGGKDAQSKVLCPISLGEPVRGTTVKYSRREIREFMRSTSDQESRGELGTQSGLRRRRGQSRSSVHPVGPSSPAGGSSTNTLEEEIHYAPSICQKITSFLEKVFSYCLIPYTFIPTSRAGVMWEITATCAAFLAAITVSMQAAYLHDQPLFWTINYVIDVFFFADMVLKLHTAHYNADGILITQPLSCAKHYLKTNFFLDMLGSFPTDLVVLATWPREVKDILRVLSLARLNRILRVYKLPLAFGHLEDKITRSSGAINELKFAVYMAIGTHWTACGWFLLACASLSIGAMDPLTCNVASWALKSESEFTVSNFTVPYQYIVSLYWATATTTTVGYGDIHAHTDLERTYASLVMVIGVVAYGYIIASVAASLANADSGRAQYQDKLQAIKAYMKDQSLDSSLMKRVINYYEYIWQRNRGVSFSSLFQGMPISLQADISLSLYKKIIDQVPLFQNTEIGFTKLLALSIKPVLFLSKEYIVRKGDIGSEMFFINRGMVDVVSEDGTVVFATMQEGKFFGEISLVFSCPRTASIRAATNCDLFVLTKQDLDRALSYYPHIAEQIRTVAGNRANLVKKRSEIAAKAAAEGKSASDAAKAAAQGTKDETEEDTKPEEKPSSSSDQPAPPPAPEQLQVEEPEPEEPAPPRSRLPSCLLSFWVWVRERAWPVLLRVLTFTVEKELTRTVFHLLGCLMAYLSAFTITYQAAFQNNAGWLWGINYIFEAYFLCEIIIKFHLAYEDDHGVTVTNFRSIALHYLKDPTGFRLDLAAILPYELIALPVPNHRIRTAVVLYFRLPHVIRIFRIRGFFTTEEKRLNQKKVLIQLLKFIVLISLCTHFVACVWYMFGCQAGSCDYSTWASDAGLVNSTLADADHYCNSLYWAVATLTTTGYGDLSATNVQEMLYAICVMIFGKLLFGFILGSIASTLANLDTQRVLFEEKLSALKDYMKEQHLPWSLQLRVLAFFDYLWVRNKGTDRQTLLLDMPYCMQAEVSLATTEEILKKVPIFASANTAFLRHLALMIKPCLFLPGEYIVHKGDMGLGMFFLYHGMVEVIDDDDPSTVQKVLREGSYFGVKGLVYNMAMESSARALTHVDMFSLSQNDFEEVLRDHPLVEKTIGELAEEQYGAPLKTDTRRASYS